MLKISIFCFIVAAIFFILGIYAEVVLINYDAGIISIIVPLILGAVSTLFIVLGCYNYDKYDVNNIKNTINISYPNAEIINNNDNEGYFIYDGKTYHFECNNGVLQVNEASSMKVIPITK